MTPRFSVVCTSYNRPRMVSNAIESTLRQTLEAWELLVADDDSNDETLAAIEKTSRGDERIILIRQAAGRPSMGERVGTTRYCATINRALKRALLAETPKTKA